MVSKADKKQPKSPPLIPSDRVGDPYAYLDASNALTNQSLAGEIDPLDAKRLKELLADDCEANTGLTFKEISKDRANPIDRFTHLMDLSLADLDKLEPALKRVDDALLGAEKKSRYLAAIARMKQINRDCVANSVKCMVYVMRDAEPNIPVDRQDSTGAGFLQMQWFHVKFHEHLNDPDFRHCLMMCHPDSGKSFNVIGWASWRVGNNPRLRVLLIQDNDDKPKKSIAQLKEIIQSPRFQALFPNVKLMLGRGIENSAFRFTIRRANRFSKEPTFEAASITSKINGNGYDLILGDDVCPDEVRNQPTLRDTINRKWVSVIEARLRGGEHRGEIKVIGTPWHPEDVLGIVRKEVKAGRLKGWRIGIDEFAIKDDQNGKAIPIWPSRWSSEFYENQKRRLGADYALNYRLEPSENKFRALQRLWFYNSRVSDSASTDVDRQRMDVISQSERWLSIDPAATRGQQSCDHGVLDAAITPNGFAFVLDVDFVQGNATEMCDWLTRRIYYAPEPGYANVLIEAQGAIAGQVHLWGQMIAEALRSGMIPDKDGTGERIATQMSPARRLPTFCYTGTRWGNQQNMSKMDRFKEVVPLIENRFVHFPGYRVNVPGGGLAVIPSSRMELFREIMFHFDGTNKSDAVDALTQFLLKNRHRLADPRIKTAKGPEQPRRDTLGALFRKAMDATMKPQEESVCLEEMDFWDERAA